MSVQEARRGSRRAVRIEDEDEQRRLSVYHLVGLAAGGVFGSGWLVGAQEAYQQAGSIAWLAWLVGGGLMLVVAWVMVELSTAAPKTGGLIFLPLQSSGPLVATVIAAGLWIFYAINSASEALAMTQGLSWKLPWLLAGHSLTHMGWVYALAFMMVISAVNLIAPRLLFRFSTGLTFAKVAIPVVAVPLLLTSVLHHGIVQSTAGGHGYAAVLAAVVDSGVIYAYVGFQAPLEFAGNIKRRGIGEAARLRWAVFGTIAASTALYIALQVVFSKYQTLRQPPAPGASQTTGRSDSPFVDFAFAANLNLLGWLLRIDAVASPFGAGLVFGQSVTREVAALSRAHLTHRGLQSARKASLRQRYDVYWLILLVDFFIGAVVLWLAGGNRAPLTAVTGILTLIIYAFPAVVLVSLRSKLGLYSPRRRTVHEALARVSFTLIALILYGAGWASMWRAMTSLAAGSILLLVFPVLSRRLPLLGRVYDAKEHVTLLRHWRTSAAAQAAIWLTAYLGVLMVLTLLGNSSVGTHQEFAVGVLVAGVALGAFEALVRTSRQHVGQEAPLLPAPTPAPAARTTEASG
ncbi:APC family permease [Kitasatospora mediocidica]|uniref:APC family permease n=1 Tax=Kitasatospora mediocidica TaxID=58352 RepID=UPI000564FF00|nr:APC family permease [Kitasatospora mediocidica]